MKQYGKLIGRGHWSKAYRLPDSNYVTIVTKDHAKEALNLFTPCNLHLPEIKRLDGFTDKHGEDYSVYTMPYYNRLVMGQLDPLDAKDLRFIRKFITPYGNGYWWLYSNYNHLSDTVDSWDIQTSLKEALQNLLSGLSNYGYEMGLEFMPRNLKMCGNRLILLDVVYSLENEW